LVIEDGNVKEVGSYDGTTTALVFGTVHPESINAFFEESSKLNMRMIAGKVMMDRKPFAPDFLSDTAQSSYDETKVLIQVAPQRPQSLRDYT
jgi:guanine deaminase